MPIDMKKFNSGNFKQRNYDIKKHPVYLFLKKSKAAWKNNEIAKQLKINKYTVRGTLKRLVKKKLVVHKAPYFAYKR